MFCPVAVHKMPSSGGPVSSTCSHSSLLSSLSGIVASYHICALREHSQFTVDGMEDACVSPDMAGFTQRHVSVTALKSVLSMTP